MLSVATSDNISSKNVKTQKFLRVLKSEGKKDFKIV